MATDDDARELILEPASPPVQEGQLAPSPYNFLFTGEDNIRVTSHNSQTGVVIAIQGRMWSAGAGIRPFGHVHVPFTDRSARTEVFTMGEGYLLNVSVFASQGTPRMGQTFVRVQVIRGSTGATYVLGTLVQDYLTSNQDLAWPGSPIRRSSDGPGYVRTLEGTSPGAGNEVNEAVPTGASWDIESIQVELTTDATVLQRFPQIQFQNGVTTLVSIWPTGGVPQSTQRKIFWVKGMPMDASTTFQDSQVQGLPTTMVLRGGQSFRTNTGNLQAADAYGSVDFQVTERLEAN